MSSAERIVFETELLSSWLWHELKALGLPVLCPDARYTEAALLRRMNKSDRDDAQGLIELARIGWYREAKVKSMKSRETRALLIVRAKLMAMRRDIENQMRGLLKSLGTLLGNGGSGALGGKIIAFLRDAPSLRPLIRPPLLTHFALVAQAQAYDWQINEVERSNPTVHRLMAIPGVGAITALAFASMIDGPTRFKTPSDVGAYLGLTPRRYQFGEIDRTGRISKFVPVGIMHYVLHIETPHHRTPSCGAMTAERARTPAERKPFQGIDTSPAIKEPWPCSQTRNQTGEQRRRKDI